MARGIQTILDDARESVEAAESLTARLHALQNGSKQDRLTSVRRARDWHIERAGRLLRQLNVENAGREGPSWVTASDSARSPWPKTLASP
jgi:hypothetical protein